MVSLIFPEWIWSNNIDINLLPHSSAFNFQLMYATKSYSHYFLSHRLKTNFFCSEALQKVALYLIMILNTWNSN
eukprot:UN21410